MQFVPIAPMQPTMVGSPSKLQPPSATEATTCLVLPPGKGATDSNNNAGPKPSRRGTKRALPAQAPGSVPGGVNKGRAGKPPKQGKNVLRRNERERNRVKQVNLGFDVLRQHVPNGAKNKKMSKVDTLRGAVEYIKYLQEVLDSDSPLDIAPFTMEFSGEEEFQEQGYPPVPTGYEGVPPPQGYTDPLPGAASPAYHTPSLPSPSGYSTDGSQGSEHYSDPCTEPQNTERAPFSPEDQELIEFASWLQFQS